MVEFPFALVLAWWFDLSAVGLRRERPVPPGADSDERLAIATVWRVLDEDSRVQQILRDRMPA